MRVVDCLCLTVCHCTCIVEYARPDHCHCVGEPYFYAGSAMQAMLRHIICKIGTMVDNSFDSIVVTFDKIMELWLQICYFMKYIF